MKKAILLILIPIALISCRRRDRIELRETYVPDMEYVVFAHQTTRNTMRILASEDVLAQLSMQGIETQVHVYDTTNVKTLTRTESADGDAILLRVELLESTDTSLVAGTRYYGKLKHNKITTDSLFSTMMSEEKKEMICAEIESMMNQMLLPRKKIWVKQSFENNMPMSMPIGSIETEINIRTVYTLRQVQNGIGYFDIKQYYTLISSHPETEISLDGTGEGSFEFDVDRQFTKRFYVDMAMLFRVNFDSFVMEVLSATKTHQTTQIRPAL